MARRTPFTAAAPPGPVGVAGRRAGNHPDATSTANPVGAGAFGQVGRVRPITSAPVTAAPVTNGGVES